MKFNLFFPLVCWRSKVDGEDRRRSTVFLDACLNGKPVKDKNMLLFVAHKLAGAEVFASKISFDNDQFVLDNYLHFNAHIMSNWVLEYYTLILFLVLGSYYSYLYLESIYFFFRVYSKAKARRRTKWLAPSSTKASVNCSSIHTELLYPPPWELFCSFAYMPLKEIKHSVFFIKVLKGV